MVEQVGTVRAAAYDLRVEHLFTPRAKVDVVCIACRHVGPVDPFVLAKFGKHKGLGEIEAKFRCTKCKLKFCKLRIEWIA